MGTGRCPLAAITLAAIAAPISGCCSSPLARSGNHATSTITATTQKAVRFSECMRRNGVSQFPDPGPSGKLTIDAVANGSSLDPSTPAFRQALGACKELEPAGFNGAPRSSAQQQAALRFAQCIRAHGVTDFPDPLPNGPLVDTNRIPSSNSPGGMSALHAAMQRCSRAAAAAGVTG